MCGIVGYIGFEDASQFMLDGLSKLEYRGYDSAGIAVIGPNNVIKVQKKTWAVWLTWKALLKTTQIRVI